MNQKIDYTFIHAWGRYMGSYSGYIDKQVERARETEAPPTAIYETSDQDGLTGKWATVEDVTSPTAITFLREWADAHGVSFPEVTR